MKINHQYITTQVIDIAKEVAHYIRSESKHFSTDNVQIKGKNDFVSYVDKQSERLLVEKLSVILPDAGFLAEEGTVSQQDKEYMWIIDPLDGTTNFIHQSTPYAISIALTYKSEPIVGVIYEITNNEMFYAWQGSKAYLNGEVITVSKVEKLSDSIIAFGRPYGYTERYNALLKSVDYFLKNTHAIRILGSAATELAYVACGRYDGRYEFNLKPWDMAAGILIIKQAGGKVCDFNGGHNYFQDGTILASNNHIFEEFKQQISLLFT